MQSIESLSINTINMAHPAGQVTIGRLEEKMAMVVHQAVGADRYIPQRNYFFQPGNKKHTLFFAWKKTISPQPIFKT